MDAETSKPRELTKDIIPQLVQLSTKDAQGKITGVMQVLEIKDNGAKMLISDGYSFVDCPIFKTARDNIKNLNIEPKDIIMVQLLFHKGKFFVIIDFSVVYQGLNSTIGNPIAWEEYSASGEINPNGDNRIPSYLWQTSSSNATRGPTTNGEDDDDDATPVSLLTPGSNSWMVRARLVSKSDIRQFGGKDTGKKPGQLFSIVIADKSGKVQATFFSDAVVKFHDMLTVGKVYTFSSGEVKKAGSFNQTNSTVELNFSTKSEIKECPDLGGIPKDVFEFCTLLEVKNKDVNSIIDVVGIVNDPGTLTDQMLKKGDTKKKRVIKLVDDSKIEIEATFWGDQAIMLDQIKKGDAIVLTGMKVGDFQGKSLSSTNGTRLITKLPDHKRVQQLIVWRNEAGKSPGGLGTFETLKEGRESTDSTVLTITSLKKVADEVLEYNDDPKSIPSYLVVGYLTMLPSGKSEGGNGVYYYDKCPNDTCFRKVTQTNGTLYECPACGALNRAPIPRFMGTFRLNDSTDSLFLKFSNDYVGNALYGQSASDLKQKEILEPEEVRTIAKERCNQLFTVKVSPRKDFYNGEHKISFTAYSVFPLSQRSVIPATKSLLHTINILKDVHELGDLK